VEANHVSCGLLRSAPSALNDPPTAERTTPMADRGNIVSKYKTKTTKQQANRKDCNNEGNKDKNLETFRKHGIGE